MKLGIFKNFLRNFVKKCKPPIYESKKQNVENIKKKQTTATTTTKEADKFNMRQMHFIK